MENLNLYKKYYFLEEYLFKEITNSFNKNHYLADEEFFSIIIWKSNRAKTKVLKGIIGSKKTIKQITGDIYINSENKEKLLEYLTNIDGIGIPIASAILSVCFPNDFTIADYRVGTSIKDILGIEIKTSYWTIPKYLEYLKCCLEIKEKFNLKTLRETDTALWGLSFKKDLDILIKEVNNSG